MSKISTLSRRSFFTQAALFTVSLSARQSEAQESGSGTRPPVSNWAKFAAIEQAFLSPDAKRIGLIKPKGENKGVYEIYLETNTQLGTILSGQKLRYAMWADNETTLIVTSKTIKKDGKDISEKIEATTINESKSKILKLFKNDSDRASYSNDFQKFRIDNIHYLSYVTYSNGRDGFYSSLSGREVQSEKIIYVDKSDRFVENWIINIDLSVVARADTTYHDGTWTLRTYNSKLKRIKNSNYYEKKT